MEIVSFTSAPFVGQKETGEIFQGTAGDQGGDKGYNFSRVRGNHFAIPSVLLSLIFFPKKIFRYTGGDGV